MSLFLGFTNLVLNLIKLLVLQQILIVVLFEILNLNLENCRLMHSELIHHYRDLIVVDFGHFRNIVKINDACPL